MPNFIVVDKNGKIASRSFVNLGDADLITVLDKQTGLSAPKVAPQPQMMPQMNMDPAAQQAPPVKEAPQQAAQTK